MICVPENLNTTQANGYIAREMHNGQVGFPSNATVSRATVMHFRRVGFTAKLSVTAKRCLF